jgi:hypothetical protein
MCPTSLNTNVTLKQSTNYVQRTINKYFLPKSISTPDQLSILHDPSTPKKTTFLLQYMPPLIRFNLY